VAVQTSAPGSVNEPERANVPPSTEVPLPPALTTGETFATSARHVAVPMPVVLPSLTRTVTVNVPLSA